jgi:3-oxoisoapionate-4-phosphate transcarboxylase/hydrolase
MPPTDSTRVSATYLIETPRSLEQAAEEIAGEQSSGTFVATPAETSDLKARHRARVERIEDVGTVAEPSLLGRYPAGSRFHRGRVTVSWPLENIGTSLPNLLPAVLGNLTELVDLSGIRPLSLELPREFVEACPRPGLGIEGTRRLTGVRDRPIVGTIVKPSVGLSPEQTAALVHELALADIDFVKDDELIASPPYSPFERRVELVMRSVRSAAEQTGRTVMVAFNITGEIDEMRRWHDAVVNTGGSCVMVSLNAVRIAGVVALARHGSLPIHGHRNGWGMLPQQRLDSHPVNPRALPAARGPAVRRVFALRPTQARSVPRR